MAICPRTGLTIPECSCSACLERQVRSHRPEPPEAEIRIVRSDNGSSERRRSTPNKAA